MRVILVEKKPNSKWKITLQVDRGNDKSYVKHISAKSTKIFIYVTFVAALWTTSAYMFFYGSGDTEVHSSKALHYLNELAQMQPPAASEPSNATTLPAEPEASSGDSSTPDLNAVKITEVSEPGFALEQTEIRVSDHKATVQMNLRKANGKPEMEGKMAGILVLRDSSTGTVYRVSSRPGHIPLTPKKTDVQARGLYYRAKHSVQKFLVFNLPEHAVFDEVSAELTFVTKNGEVKTFDVQKAKELESKSLKIGDSRTATPAIH